MIDPTALAPAYSRFRVTERILLSGHSHQAWPDAGFAGQEEAWTDAAEHVDDKWERAFAMADRVRQGYRGLLGDADGDYALGVSTHQLVVAWLSALPLQARPRLVTSAGEFHSLRRQLDRLAEEGVAVERVPVDPIATLTERMAAALDDGTAAVAVSAVLFRDARIVPGLGVLAAAARRRGIPLLVDAYHALNAMPFPLAAHDLGDAYVTGAGYKYCQLGEGNAFLRLPPGCNDRPVITGWFSEFTALTQRQGGPVTYGRGGDRYAAATYDPTSHYRAARVFDFFAAQHMTPQDLRTLSQRQVARFADAFDAADLDPAVVARPDVPLEAIGGFLSLRCADAAGLHASLKARGVWTDFRENLLRVGPAPYVTDQQLDEGVAALVEAALGG